MSDRPPVAIASDHAGLVLKQQLLVALAASGTKFDDLGCHDETSVDYPDYAHVLSRGIIDGKYARGILVCGTGMGMCMAANRHRGIRAAACSDTFTARMTRMHNDANVLCLGSRVIGPGLAQDIVEIFLKTAFEGGRHTRRIDKIEP
jgi:ribose 5-phosphate isomerase B